MSDDEPTQGIVTPCDMCMETGELVTLHGRPVLRAGTCPRCGGTGHLHIPCAEEEIEAVAGRLPATRVALAVRGALTSVGLCGACFGSERIASIECDEDGVPRRYVEVACPAPRHRPAA